MDEIIVIMQQTVDSYDGRSWFAAVATDTDAAKRWIQDEVDGKHDNGHQYAQGKTADWWIEYGTFVLKPATLHN